MDYVNMEFEDLKKYAKSIGITFGKIGKEKLIEKITEKKSELNSIESVLSDGDIEEDDNVECVESEPKKEAKSLVESITSAIDDLEDSTDAEVEVIEDIPLDMTVGVKSITFGGLTYKSRTTNALFRWNQIGSIQYMTVAELNEMNNYKSDFLRRPFVILLDEKAIKKFRLTPIYENVARINNLSAVFRSDLRMIESVIDNAIKVNMRDILISKIRQMYKTKKLVDINVIRLLEKKLNFDLTSDEQ